MDTLISQMNQSVLVVYFADAHLVGGPKIEAIGDALVELMKRAEHGKMLLNFQAVKLMTSAMLGKLLGLKKHCTAAKVTLKLCGLTDDILEVFKVTKLNKVFDIHDDESAAMKSYGRLGRFFGR